MEEQKRIEERLKYIDKLSLIGTLVGEIAHEIGTPLNVISARAELAMMKVGKDHPSMNDLRIIVQQIEQTSQIFRNLLDFSKRRPPRFTDCDVNEIVTRVLGFLRARTGSKQIVIEFNPAADLPAIHADPNQVEQMLVNIIINSIESLRPQGKIQITVEAKHRGKADGVLLSVRDEGAGIAPELIEKIFEPFFSTRATTEGTGLGLATAKQIVLEHSGDIAVESAVGKGTTFRIFLPSR